jgi:metallo-beta-lactamase family protein
MPFNIKFHGALGEVTGSCTFIRVVSTGNIYAIDCGSSHKKNLSHELAHPDNLPSDCDLTKIKGLFLTHAHMDHIGMLLHWIKKGFIGKIYCTEETKRFTVHMLEDSVRINLREKVETGVGEAEISKIKDLLKNYNNCKPGEQFYLESSVIVNSYPSSHIIGCVGFQFSATDTKGVGCRVYFTGDVGGVENEVETASMMRTRVKPSNPSDYIITESTYGASRRQKTDRSGKQRIAKLSQVIERGFRHGTKSKFFFPCFSLQRAQDLLLDLYHVLCLNRTSTGLPDGVVPKIYLDSRLTSLLMHEYSEIYQNGILNSSQWVNPHSLFYNEFGVEKDKAKAILEKLFRFQNIGDCVRLYDHHENPKTAIEVFCGPFRPHSQGPVIVLCGSGMTLSGAIQSYIRDYIQDENTTFVLSGYVPPRSPGAVLKKIFELPESERHQLRLELKEDNYRSLPKINLFGSDIKAQCSLISEFYSGHADGPSICRYVLEDNSSSLSKIPKRIFLTHGDDEKRKELSDLFYDIISKSGFQRNSSLIQCPKSKSAWFDCEKNKWLENKETKLTLYLFIKSSKLQYDDIIQFVKMSCMASQFKKIGSNYHLNYSSSSNAAKINTTIKLKEISNDCFKLNVETNYSAVRDFSDIRLGAFRWREVLNALGIQKRDYFVGHKYVGKESEFEELEGVIKNLVANGKQRQIGFIVAGAGAFLPDEVATFEALLTPHIHFYILDQRYISRINTILFSQNLEKITESNAFYIPVGTSKPFVKITKPFNLEWLSGILALVDSDLSIIHSRQPFVPPITNLKLSGSENKVEVKNLSKVIPKFRAKIPEAAYSVLSAGQKVVVSVVCAVEGKNKQLLGYRLKVKSTGAVGLLRSINFIESKFDYQVGTELETYIKNVNASQHEVEFVMLAPYDEDADLNLIKASLGKITYQFLSNLLKLDYPTFKGYYADFFRFLGNEEQISSPESLVPAGYEIEIYQKIRHHVEVDKERKASFAPPVIEFTFSQMAEAIGEHNWNSADVYNALVYFEKAEQIDLSEMAKSVLKNSTKGIDSDLFPIEHKKLFFAACVEASEAKWPASIPHVTILPTRILTSPSFYSLNDLAIKWCISPTQLLMEAESLGIQLLPQVVVTAADAEKLRCLSIDGDQRVLPR